MINCNLCMAIVSFAFHVSSSNTLIQLFNQQFFIRELLSMFTFDSNAPTSPSYFKKKNKFKNRNSNNVVLLMKQSHSWALAVLVILIFSIFLSFIPFCHLFYMFMRKKWVISHNFPTIQLVVLVTKLYYLLAFRVFQTRFWPINRASKT